MKRIIAGLMIAIIVLSFAACATDNDIVERDGKTYITLYVNDDNVTFKFPISAFLKAADLTADQIEKEQKAAEEEGLEYNAYLHVLSVKVGDITLGSGILFNDDPDNNLMNVALDEKYITIKMNATDKEISELMYDYKSSDDISGSINARIFHSVDRDKFDLGDLLGTASNVSIGKDKDCIFTVKDNRTK